MPILPDSDYRPPFYLRNGHLNTNYAYFRRKIKPAEYRRVRINTPDADFIDIDTLFDNNKKCIILCHGLEGSSSSQYIIGTAKLAAKMGWDVIALNYRGCSGEINKTSRLYHSGFTEDLELVISKYENIYDSISLVGFSLGGNIVLKYMGNSVVSNKIHKAGAISVPTDLSICAQEMKKFKNIAYTKNFINSLNIKIRQKHKQFPDLIDLSYIPKIKSVWDYDEYYTSQLHGFDGAEDYYAKCGSRQFLHKIDKPTLIINALDDPFFPIENTPFDEANENPNLFLQTTKYGGHVGFSMPKHKNYWCETKMMHFLNS